MHKDTLSDLPFVERFISFDTIDSTNSYAKTLSPLPHDKLLVIQADKQIAGRGRHDRRFHSDVVGGLWVSVIVPIDDIATHFIHNRALALSICSTLLEISPEAPVKIKWPNDIYWGDHKCAGILLESTPHSANHLIAGFGLNVNILREQFPSELHGIATSLQIENGMEYPIEELLKRIINTFESLRRSPPHEVHQQYEKHLYRQGELIKLDEITGRFISVREDGHIQLETEAGMSYFQSGILQFLKK